jgi:hypothetical protein
VEELQAWNAVEHRSWGWDFGIRTDQSYFGSLPPSLASRTFLNHDIGTLTYTYLRYHIGMIYFRKSFLSLEWLILMIVPSVCCVPRSFNLALQYMLSIK